MNTNVSAHPDVLRGSGFLHSFCKQRLAMAGLIVLILEVLAVIFLPIIFHMDGTTITAAVNQAPSAEHILGTDALGRDMLARILYGGRVSLLVGLSAVVISVIIGVPLGILAGYYRGAVEMVIMRLADVFMSLPTMILVLVLVVIFDPSILVIILVIGVVGWTSVAKLVYGSTLSVRNKEYIESAKAIGTKDIVIFFREILPNVMTPIWMTLSFRVSSAILTESSLSFLGSGVQPPDASWGNIINAAQSYVVLTTRPWQWIPAGVCLFITIVAINLIGEGIRDVMDPKTKKK